MHARSPSSPTSQRSRTSSNPNLNPNPNPNPNPNQVQDQLRKPWLQRPTTWDRRARDLFARLQVLRHCTLHTAHCTLYSPWPHLHLHLHSPWPHSHLPWLHLPRLRAPWQPHHTLQSPPLIWQVHQAAVHACLCDNFNTAGAMTALLATCSDANSYVKVQRYSLLPSKRHT